MRVRGDPPPRKADGTACPPSDPAHQGEGWRFVWYRTRPQGRHLTDDDEHNRRIWREAMSVDRRADLVIDTGTTTVADAVELIVDRYGSMRYTPPASDST